MSREGGGGAGGASMEGGGGAGGVSREGGGGAGGGEQGRRRWGRRG